MRDRDITPKAENPVFSLNEASQQQRLPNECLLLIIQELKFDIPKLYNLLTVNRFFFEEALRLMMVHPFGKRRLEPFKYNSAKHSAKESLLAVVLCSALQREWLKHQAGTYQRLQMLTRKRKRQGDNKEEGAPLVTQDSTHSDPGWSQFAQNSIHGQNYLEGLDSIMSGFGLKLSFSDFHPRESYFQLTTVDYSGYLSSLFTGDLYNLDLRKIVCLRFSAGNNVLRHAQTQDDSDDIPNKETAGRLVRFLLHHSSRQILNFGFDLYESAQFVDYAPMMPNLQKLWISITCPISDYTQYTHYAKQFIYRNQGMSPSKHRLNLEYIPYELIDERPRFTDDESEQGDWVEERHKWYTDNCLLLKLYEAIGRPRSMDVSVLPLFYKESCFIETENLVSFVDHDTERWEAGEGPDMEAFLRRCPELRNLEISVGKHLLFQWLKASSTAVAQTIQPSVLAYQQPPLSKLTHLKLASEDNYWIPIQTLNDIVAASGKSLETVSVNQAWHDLFPEDRTEETLLGLSQGLLSIPRATTIGYEWHLPRVRKIDLLFEGTVSIGSFDQCPLLESLSIRYGFEGHYGLGDVGPMEPMQQNAFLESLTCLPVWKLPRLRLLSLEGMAAVQFNFESIKFMKRLQSLKLEVNFEEWFPSFANKYLRLCPSEILSVIEKTETPPIYEPISTFYPWHWSSNSLIELSIAGPAAMMFHLGQLAQFPSLEKLDLKAPPIDAYTFLNTREQALAKLYSCQTMMPQDPSFNLDHILDPASSSSSLSATETREENSNTIPESSRSRPNHSQTEGSLQHLGFTGNWDVVVPNFWTQILTKYAPHLCSLSGFSNQDPCKQVRDIEEAYRIIEAIQEKKPRDCLPAVFPTGNLCSSCRREMGIRLINDRESGQLTETPGSRIYKISERQTQYAPRRYFE